MSLIRFSVFPPWNLGKILVYIIKFRFFHVLSISFMVFSYYFYANYYLELQDCLLLLFLSLLIYLYGFFLNDYIDYELDSQNMYRKRWLIVAYIPRNLLLLVIVLLPFFTILFYYIFISSHPAGIGLLLLSCVFATFYNIKSKYGPVPKIFAEISISISLGLLPVIGFWKHLDSKFPIDLANISIHIFLLYLFLNSVFAGLKDIKFDASGGARSFILETGCVIHDDDRIIFSILFRCYSYVLIFIIFFHSYWFLGFNKFLQLICFLLSLFLTHRMFSVCSYSKIGRATMILIPLISAAPFVFSLLRHANLGAVFLFLSLASTYLLNQKWKRL